MFGKFYLLAKAVQVLGSKCVSTVDTLVFLSAVRVKENHRKENTLLNPRHGSI
jgi:hypothetical protein